MLKNIKKTTLTQPFFNAQFDNERLNSDVIFSDYTKKVVEFTKNDLITTCNLIWKKLIPT